MMKKILLVLGMVLVLGTLTGCTDYAKKYDQNTLVVKSNGTLIEVAVEDFSESSVTPEGLSVYITEQIDQYNDTQDKDMVEKDNLITEDMSEVKLVLKYKNMESYNDFNLLHCTLDDFSDVDEKSLKGTFTSADGKSVKVGKMEGVKKAKVLIISEKMDIVLDGTVLYYNKEVSVNDDVISTTGKGNAIVIFK